MAIERRLNDDHSDYLGPTIPCSCGHQARYDGRLEKTFITVLGPIILRRAHYLCAECERGRFPRDHELGFLDGALSPGVSRMVGVVAASVSFAESAELLLELSGLSLNAKQIERHAEALGRDIEVADRRLTMIDTPTTDTMYLAMDGTGVPMRPAETAGRAGKQPDGTAKTREAKLVVVWTAEGRDAEGIPVRDHGSVSYSGAIESAADNDTDDRRSPFAQRVWREARRRGFSAAKRQVVLGDGAPWIWNIADELFPGAVQIVDRYHVKENIAKAEKAIFGNESISGKEWLVSRFKELDEGRLEELLTAMTVHASRIPEAEMCHRYITKNKSRMDYPRFRSQGLCTSSGVMEAGCKISVGARLKRAGMHWTVNGANAILALRCCRLSSRFDAFWQERRSGKAA